MYKLVFSIIFIMTFIHSHQALSCINDEVGKRNIDLDLTESSIDAPKTSMQSLRDSIAKSPKQLYEEKYEDALFDNEKNAKTPSSFIIDEHAAIKELLTGDISKAINLFLTIEKKFPDYYSTASNLGTAYELNGNNIEALKWINEGIHRNNESHYGTEWLHALILEAKINIDHNPDYYSRRRILNLPDSLFSFSKNTILRYDNKDYSLDEVERALAYQLKERLIFIKENDLIVSDLLFSYSRILAFKKDYETAISLLNLSASFGFKDKALWSKTMAEYYNPQL